MLYRAHQRHVRPGVQRRLRQRVALLAAGTVGKEAHRVERLARPASRHHNSTPGQRPTPPQHAANFPDQRRRLWKPPFARQPGRKAAFFRLDEMRAPVLQGLDIGLCRRMLVHAPVHCGRDHQRAARRQRRHCEQVVGQAMRQLGYRVSRRRSDYQQVSPLGQPHVRDVRRQAACAVCLPQIRIHRASGDRLESQRRDELLRRVRHEDIYQRPRLRQLAGEIYRFIHGDAARDGEDDALMVEKSDGFEGHERSRMQVRVGGDKGEFDAKISFCHHSRREV